MLLAFPLGKKMKVYGDTLVFWDYASQWQGEEVMQKILILAFCWNNQIHCISQCKFMQILLEFTVH